MRLAAADNAARSGNSVNDDAMTAAVGFLAGTRRRQWHVPDGRGQTEDGRRQTAVNRLQHLVAAALARLIGHLTF